MGLLGVEFHLLGLRTTVAELQSSVGGITLKAAAGLTVGGRAIRDQAKQNMSAYRYKRRVESKTTVGRPFFAPTHVNVSVGLHRGSNAPEGRVFEFKWHPRKGKQPPVDVIALWLASKPGLANTTNLFKTKRSPRGRVRPGHTRASISAEKNIRRQAFAIARAILRRPGLAVGEVRWLDDAAASKMPVVVAAVTTALRNP